MTEEVLSRKKHQKVLGLIKDLRQSMDKIDSSTHVEKIAALSKKNGLLEEIRVPALEKLKAK